MPKQQNKPAATGDSVLDDVHDTMKRGVKHIREQMDAIVRGKAEKNGHDKASRIAFLMSKLALIADSIRKVEAAKAKRRDKLTTDDVIEFVRALEPQERTRVVRALVEIDNRKSGLA